MLFSELASAELPEFLRSEVDRLLEIKINSPEVKLIHKIDILNEYLDRSITEIKSMAANSAEKRNNNLDTLNNLFIQTIGLR